MNTIQKNPGKRIKDPHGLLKIGLIVAGFIISMIVLKFLMDILSK
jgi:hypothetical protein